MATLTAIIVDCHRLHQLPYRAFLLASMKLERCRATNHLSHVTCHGFFFFHSVFFCSEVKVHRPHPSQVYSPLSCFAHSRPPPKTRLRKGEFPHLPHLLLT